MSQSSEAMKIDDDNSPSPPVKKRGRKSLEPVQVRKVIREFLGEFSLEDHMMKEAAVEAVKFRNRHQ